MAPGPSLSSLQAALRKGTTASKAGSPAAVPSVREGTSPSLKRLRQAEDGAQVADGAPPPKKRTAVGAVVKTPGAAPVATAAKSAGPAVGTIRKAPAPGAPAMTGNGKATSGLSAKSGSLPPTPSPGAVVKTPGKLAAQPQKAKVGSPVTKKPGPSLMQPLVKRPPAAPEGDRSALGASQLPPKSPSPAAVVEDVSVAGVALGPGSVGEFVAAIEASSSGNKVRHVVRLAEAVGMTFQIDTINHFLKALKSKMVERAQRDGVRVPANTGSPPVGGAGTGGVPSKQPGAATKLKAPTPQAPLQKAKAAQPPPAAAQVEEAPPASPPPTDLAGEDPLYVLVGELTEDPVSVDGALVEARLGEVLKRLWDGIARKPKDWVAAWQAMGIPADKQSEALQRFLNMTFMQTEDPDRAPMIVAELVKAHKVKMRSVEDVLVAFGHNLDGILAINEEAWQVYAQFLVHVFPKPLHSGWGWSRVGWSWQSWWQFAEKCVATLEASRAFDVLALILRLIQDKEGLPIAQVQVWSEGEKLQRVVTKLGELGSCDAAEVVEKLSLQGVMIEA
mmetsp:Transcript_96022/g.213790  ORF Transcript_96022/g.213790 Transcript_96022/m.213790 type:complete len:560 (-) Transcript_96022:26-1705(-)